MLSKDLSTFAGLQVYTVAQEEPEGDSVPMDPESEARRWDERYGVTRDDAYEIAQELQGLG